MCLSALARLVAVVPMLACYRSTRTNLQYLTPLVINAGMRVVGLTMSLVGVVAQMIFSMYAINEPSYYDDFGWGFC